MDIDNLIRKAKLIEDPELKLKEEELFNHIKNSINPVLRFKYLKIWIDFVEKNSKKH